MKERKRAGEHIVARVIFGLAVFTSAFLTDPEKCWETTKTS
jgi:hypothetical protein